ncbi:MAG: tetratricopeptide repeat protein [Flavobacteriaceae bacterium]
MKKLFLLSALLIFAFGIGQTAEDYLNSGMDKARTKDYKQALNDFSNCINLYNKRIDKTYLPDAYYNRGTIKGLLGDYSGAVLDLNEAIVLDPKYSRYFYQRGLLKQILNDYSGALDDYTKSIEFISNSKLEETEAMIGGSISVDDNPKKLNLDNLTLAKILVAAYSNRGTIKQKFSDFSGAVNDFNNAIDLEPNDAELYYNRGYSKTDLFEYQEAIDDYSKAIEINPNYTSAYANRSALKEALGDMSGACTDAKLAAKLGHIRSKNWAANQCN